MRVIVTFLNDVRECERVGDTLTHVLNRAFVINVDDPRILAIREV